MNDKEKDRELLLSYIKEHGRASVNELKERSGAEPLRVDAILFEEVYNNKLNVLKRGLWGEMVSVEWRS